MTEKITFVAIVIGFSIALASFTAITVERLKEKNDFLKRCNEEGIDEQNCKKMFRGDEVEFPVFILLERQ